MRNKIIIISLSILLLIGLGGIVYYYNYLNNNITSVEINNNNEPKDMVMPINKQVKIDLSFAGDCTIGWDDRYSYVGRFDYYLDKNNNDYGYYFKNVKDFFAQDDLTIVNLEGNFTDYDKKIEKKFNFKAPKEYANVLVKGNVDIVSFANNHAYDYGQIGYNDTIDALNLVNIPYYGYSTYLIKEIKGIKIGFMGFLDIYGERFREVDKAIKYLKDNDCDLIIASMHWGIEYDYKQSNEQIRMGHYLIDNGVDLVIGHHPHIVQGIEKYKDKYIIYSLGNFSFGGNQNPKDKDTFIWRHLFTFEDSKLVGDEIKNIPASLSSAKNVNNYQPIILDGDDGKKVLDKIMKYSTGFEYAY